MSYQKMVLSIFVVLLVIVLVAYGIMLYNASSSEVYPPVQATCPDWWISKKQNNKSNGCGWVGKRRNLTIFYLIYHS